MGNSYVGFFLLAAFYLMSYGRDNNKTTCVESSEGRSSNAKSTVDGNHMDCVFLRWIRRYFGNITNSCYIRPCRVLWICDSLHIDFASVSLQIHLGLADRR